MKKFLILGIFLISSLPVRGLDPVVEEGSSARLVAQNPQSTVRGIEGYHPDALLTLQQILAHNPSSSIIVLVFLSPGFNAKNSLTPSILPEGQIEPREFKNDGTEKGTITLPPPLVTEASLPPPPPPPPFKSQRPPVKEIPKPTGTSKLLADIQAGKSLKHAEESTSPQKVSLSAESCAALLTQIQAGKSLNPVQQRIASNKVSSPSAAGGDSMNHSLEKKILERRISIAEDEEDDEEEGEKEDEWKE